MFVLSSIFSYGLVGTIPIKNQALLGLAYLFFAALMLGAFWVFRRTSAAVVPMAAGAQKEVEILADAI
jgi:hypothetical protein